MGVPGTANLARVARKNQHAIDVPPEFGQLFDLVSADLLAAIHETVGSDSPEPARQRVARMLELDESVEDGGPPPVQGFALLVLTEWLSRWRAEDGNHPDPDQALDWIAKHLGSRYRARARYLIAMISPDSGRGHEAVQLYADALGDDFLPTLIWIATALTVLHGEPGLDQHPVPS